MADGRDFVCNFTKLNKSALEAGVSVITGASTVPAISSAVVEKYKNSFSALKSIKYGITPGAKSGRGLATTESVLSYRSSHKMANK